MGRKTFERRGPDGWSYFADILRRDYFSSVDGIIYHEVEAIFVGRKMRKEYAGGVFGGDIQVRVWQYSLQLVDIYRLFAESHYLTKKGLSNTLNSLVVIIRYSSKKTRSSSGTTTAITQQRQKEWNSPLRDCIEKRDHFALNCQPSSSLRQGERRYHQSSLLYYIHRPPTTIGLWSCVPIMDNTGHGKPSIPSFYTLSD